ncbi:hypothetical protein X975_14742, partial [Stegodyphus mimosarum]
MKSILKYVVGNFCLLIIRYVKTAFLTCQLQGIDHVFKQFHSSIKNRYNFGTFFMAYICTFSSLWQICCNMLM